MEDEIEHQEPEINWDEYIKSLTDRLNSVTEDYMVARKFITEQNMHNQFTAYQIAYRMER